ncbi:ribonuclease H-like domain-containing protein [Tanacetum coccineum]
MLESLGLVPRSSNTKFVCSKEDYGEVMFIEIIRDDDEPQNEGEVAPTEEPIETLPSNLLRELHSPLLTATLIYYDNVSAIYMSANPLQHQRTKHIEIDIHFVCDIVTTGHVRVLHAPSHFQYADIFTRGLPSVVFEDFRSSLSVRPPPALTARAY